MKEQSLSYQDPRREEARSGAILGRVTQRLLPFLLLLYFCNLLDRGNVGFAKLTMQKDLGMEEVAYSAGAGIFYFGYLLFEVPSNLILRRTGTRRWMSRIMISWGLVSCATMFVTGPWSFYLARILLGVAEAGFFPGIIFYLTFWFPARERARAVATFMAANAVAGILSNPLSGGIMEYMNQVGGLHGWQWLFLLEGLPSVFFGVLVLFYLTDRPEQATWLAAEDRSWLAERMHAEEKQRQQRHGADLLRALVDLRVWFLIALYFTVAFSSNAGSIYLPQLIQQRFQDCNKFEVGLLGAIPSACALVGMLVNGALSDRTGARRGHVAGAAFLAAAGWTLAALSDSGVAGLMGFCLALTGMMSMLPPFWSLPTSFLSGAAAAGGIALINSVGNVGGLVGPGLTGLLLQTTGSFTWALLTLALMMGLGGILALFARHDPVLDQRLPAKDAS